MNIKLGKMGIFIILLLVLLSSALGVTAYETFVSREGMEDNEENDNDQNDNDQNTETSENMSTSDQVNSYNDTQDVNNNSSTYSYTSQPVQGQSFHS